jgi:phosphoenolpyruvate-protein kinase (PTS system EI component)
VIDKIADGDTIVLDGSEGIVIVKPTDQEMDEYTAKRESFLQEKKDLERFKGVPTVTKDGVHIELVANIGNPDDLAKVLGKAWACSARSSCLWTAPPCPRRRSSLRHIRRWRRAYPASR